MKLERPKMIKRDAKVLPNDPHIAAEAVGGNQFELILIAAERARELKYGATAKIHTDHGVAVTALLEIEQGLYTKKDWIEKNRKRK